MPRKSASKAAATPKTASEDAPSRRSGLRTPAKKPAKESATPTTEPKRSRRSSTAAQTAASQADSKKTRSQSPDNKSGDESTSRSSTRRPMKKVNYEESDGDDGNAPSVGKEDDYNEDEDDNDSDSLESTKNKGKVKATPSKTRNSRASAQNSRSPKGSRSRKKKDEDEDDDEEDEEKDEDKEESTAKATSGRRGRRTSGKAASQEEEEKPKGKSRGRKAAASASPATSPPARPSRAARQRKSASTEEKPETPKPVRSSTRSRKKVEPQEDQSEEMEEEESEQKEDETEETEQKDEKEKNKKRKLDQVEDEEEKDDDEEREEEEHKAKKAKVDDADVEVPNESDCPETEEKEDEQTEEKEEPAEEPMEVDSKEEEVKTDDKPSAPVDEKIGHEAVESEHDSEADDKDGDEEQEVGEDETVQEDKTDDKIDEDEDQDEELNETEEQHCEEPLENTETKVSETDVEIAETPVDLGTSANQNSPVLKQSPTKLSTPSASADACGEQTVTATEEPANSAPPVVSDSPKPTNCEPFQSSPVKNQDSVNGTSSEDVPNSVSEPKEMLPSSAIELNQQQQLAPAKPQSDVIHVSANGHFTDDKCGSGATTNDCSSGFLHGRPYFPNRSSCAEALSRHKERTFGLVSLNLESTKVDDKFCLELKSFVSDIVCIQGISQELFSEQLEPSLNALGYKGTFAQDGSQAVATFYKSSLFQLKSQKNFTLKQTISKDLERSMSPVEVSVVAEKIPIGGQVLFTNLALTQSNRAVVVANVMVPPSDISIQALQMSCLAREAVLFVESGGTGVGVPLVFCGAFNMEQQGAAYQLLRDGYLSNEMIEALQSKKELKLPGRDEDTSLVNLLWKSFQHSTSCLKSCYLAVTGQELVVDSQGSLRTSPDLIWFTSDSLTPIGVLQAPSNPTEHHMLLKANLAFNY